MTRVGITLTPPGLSTRFTEGTMPLATSIIVVATLRHQNLCLMPWIGSDITVDILFEGHRTYESRRRIHGGKPGSKQQTATPKVSPHPASGTIIPNTPTLLECYEVASQFSNLRAFSR